MVHRLSRDSSEANGLELLGDDLKVSDVDEHQMRVPAHRRKAPVEETQADQLIQVDDHRPAPSVQVHPLDGLEAVFVDVEVQDLTVFALTGWVFAH